VVTLVSTVSLATIFILGVPPFAEG
jgi:hypothetical protein